MLSVPEYSIDPTDKVKLLESIKEVLDIYSTELESNVGVLQIEHSNYSNWLFFNCNYMNTESEFGNAIFGIAQTYELNSCQQVFKRLASIDASPELSTPRIFVDNGMGIEDCGEVDSDTEGWQNDAAVAIFDRIQDILEEMKKTIDEKEVENDI